MTNFETSSYNADALPDAENEGTSISPSHLNFPYHTQLCLMVIVVSLAIVEADVLDLDLRMSQPNAPDSKRDNNIMAAGLQLTFPESSSAMVSQVKKLQQHQRIIYFS